MQISAANLLLVAQQPRTNSRGGGAHTAFAAALNENEATVRFAPPDFAAEASNAQARSEEPAASVQPKPATGYSTMPAPGAQLDIRV